jgi:hypothetical protein
MPVTVTPGHLEEGGTPLLDSNIAERFQKGS